MRGGEPRGAAAPCFAEAFLERRLWLCPASRQVVAALDVEAVTLSAVVVVVTVAGLAFAAAGVDAAGAAAAVLGRAGAGSPRDSASSRRRVLITPLRSGIWRWSAVGGGGGGVGWIQRPPYARWNGSGCVPPHRRRSRVVHPREKEPAPRLWP